MDAVIVPPADLQVEVLLTDGWGCLRVAAKKKIMFQHFSFMQDEGNNREFK